ncbi:MAG: hypothetical protein JXB15_15160 [Anaerolineales bacterium]|nr:hypothetical protein [Anaerolineales bacterium]
MDNKNTGIIATVVATLLCGCPGLLAMCMGLMFAVVSQFPDAEIDIFGSNDPQSALGMGIGGLCLGLVFIAIPIAVGFFMLRKKPGAAPTSNEPIPPAL